MDHAHTISSQGGSLGKNVVQPSLVINFVILLETPSVVAPLHGEVRPNVAIASSSEWLPCNGSAVSRAVYSSLFAVIGTAFGSGDGSTTFNLPDLRGRAPMGAGAGPSLTARTVGSSLGEERHALTVNEMPSHNHGSTGSTSKPHTHTFQFPIYTAENGPDSGKINAWTGSSSGSVWGYVRQVTASSGVNHQHSISAEGSGVPHNVMQPSIVVRYLIRV